ncbi:CACTA en-spm transposon protein [Cucumis melo var. makuwa]|uniref:CACTA en-spm transposon protein n=1 Tax=Cucumis melo var. makuwa TaxID=1194695 RepID=A0A5D3C7M0_CUCMM|nr:CACTA en-spm transposon protein [Cucumis melo var. makuwa]
MESFPSDFHEANMFLKLENAFNDMGGSSSVGDTSDQSRINKAPRVKQPYNHSSKSNSFLQRQHKLIKQQGYPVNHVKLFRETHVNRSGQFVSQATADAHNQMLELQSQRTPKGSQPLSGDKICRPFWVGDPATQKLLVGASSPSPERVLLPVLPLHMNKRCTIERLAN